MAASKIVLCFTLVFVLLQSITISSAGLPGGGGGIGTLPPLPSGVPSGLPMSMPGGGMPSGPTTPAGKGTVPPVTTAKAST